jgi:hypothetical protein
MSSINEIFEDYYRKWKAAIQKDEVTLSSRSEDYINNPDFEAIVDLGPEAVPYILAKLQTDEDAHFLVYALERITNKKFTNDELAAARERYGAPLGNQGLAAMWQEWWDKQRSSDEGSSFTDSKI